MRQIVLDTETTGLSVSAGHRLIEIGCVELINRRYSGNIFHRYINPQRKVDPGALAVHGISNDFLNDKPTFSKIYKDLLAFINGAELIIHNAPFDLSFLNFECSKINKKHLPFEEQCVIIDTLLMARKQFPAQKNNLDALSKRLKIDTTERELHGALLDAKILANVYLEMTKEQEKISFAQEKNVSSTVLSHMQTSISLNEMSLFRKTILPEEARLHQEWIDTVSAREKKSLVWEEYACE